MAISQVDVAVLSDFAGTQSPVMTLPSGLSAGDQLIYMVASTTSFTTTLLTDHNRIGTEQDVGTGDAELTWVQYEITGTEGASITLTNIFNTNEWGAVICTAWRGVDDTTPIDTSAQSKGNGQNYSGPSITPSQDDCYIMQWVASDPSGAVTGTPDSSPVTTELHDAVSSTNRTYCFVQGYQQTTAAALALDASVSVTDSYGYFQVALRTAVGGGGTIRRNPFSGPFSRPFSGALG